MYGSLCIPGVDMSMVAGLTHSRVEIETTLVWLAS